MEEIAVKKESCSFQRTTRGYIPENVTLHNHQCEDLKPYITYSLKIDLNMKLYFNLSI
jgi:hypothetical protein